LVLFFNKAFFYPELSGYNWLRATASILHANERLVIEEQRFLIVEVLNLKNESFNFQIVFCLSASAV